MPSRCDLHVHSRFSDRPSEWYLERIGAPESYTEPLDLDRVARARGMDFVTIADHDTIDGALEIAHLPGTFLSCEITAAFPEDGTQVHVLAWGIDEDDHRELQRRRGDLYALVELLRERDLAHALAHPLFRVDDRLTVAQLERCLLLFDRFELVNGTRDPRATELFRAVVDALSPELLERLADRHGLDPGRPLTTPKSFVGGSDDHCGLYAGTTWTETPDAATPGEFLAAIRAGTQSPGGEPGSSLKLARAFQSLAHDFYRRRVLDGSRWRNDPIADLLRRMAAGEIDPEGADAAPWLRTLRQAVAFLPTLGPVRPTAAMLRRAGRRSESALAREQERAVFEGSARLSQRAAARALDAAAAAFERGRPFAALPALSTLATAVTAASPYLAAFGFQHKDEPFHREVAGALPGLAGLRAKSGRRAWATDTLTDVNGVARTVATGAALARRRGVAVTVVTSLPAAPRAEFDLENFPPVWQRPIPGYEELELRVPPFLETIEWLERERIAEVVVSTPGPVGLTSLGAARLLGIPATAIHHTDFPRYVLALGLGERVAAVTASYLRWFYGLADRVLVSSETYREELLRLGVDDAKLGGLPRGVDAERFHPDRRQRGFWARYGLLGGPVLLYVGRLAPEKNLEVLLAAFAELRRARPGLGLAIVGDGPSRGALEAVAGDGVVFCGYLAGEELAAAYASADLFVFPSRTDTFGNAVLEAMASALPVVVARDGGPAEQVEDGRDGVVADASSVPALAATLRSLIDDPRGRAALGTAARAAAERRGWDGFLATLFGIDASDDAEVSGLARTAVG